MKRRFLPGLKDGSPCRKPDHRHHVSLSVADLDAQKRWYQQALGFSDAIEQFEVPEPRVRTAVLRAPNGVRVELIERAGSGRTEVYGDPFDTARGQGYGHWALEVDDLEEATPD